MNDWSLSTGELRGHLQEMDPYQLEELVAELWRAIGYEATVTDGARDRGIDVVCKKKDPFRRKQLLQVKRYNKENSIGSAEIRRYRTLYDQEDDVDLVAIITTSEFTADALVLAEDLSVRIMDGNMLSQNLLREIGIDGISNFVELAESDRSSIAFCPQCGESFSEKSAMREHAEESHPNLIFCPQCDESFSEKSAMREHAEESHPNLFCRYCDQSFPNEESIRKHLSNEHELSEMSRIDRKKVQKYMD